MNPLEVVAVVFGLVSVWLASRQHIASWPTAIVNVAIFFVLFWEARLYADSVLQLFYLTLSAYGWWAWLHGGPRKARLRVSRAGRRVWAVGAPMALVGGLTLGTVLARYTDSPVPYIDAMLTSTSLFAQWMMTRKMLENWIVWIIADIVYVPMFISRGLPFTSVQYAVFLVLAVMGFVGWRKSWNADRAAAQSDAASGAMAVAGAR
ncbi:MAG: nicotinamide riboside transporter PnuC [Gemmatimonadetes bacterium]|nr:nicotinamide riboside transporter PnuC [Gemmatimonadota bacterium]